MKSTEKETTIDWNGYELTVHYEPNGNEALLYDVYCDTDPIGFLTELQGTKYALDNIATLVAEQYTSDEFDVMEYGEQMYEYKAGK